MVGGKKKGGRPSTRCMHSDCSNCMVYKAATELPNIGAKKRKKRQHALNHAKNNHPCDNRLSVEKRQRTNEAAQLAAPVSGGRFRGSNETFLAAAHQQHDQSKKQTSAVMKASPTGGRNDAAMDEDLVHGISPEELLITVDALQALLSCCTKSVSAENEGSVAVANKDESLTSHPDLLTVLCQKRYKDLRTALYPFVSALHSKYESNATASYQSRVTSSLQAARWTDAYTALKGMLEIEVGETAAIKRGTVQRWVRLCDDCPHPNLKLKILRAVLACSPQDGDDVGKEDVKDLNKHDPRRVLKEYEEEQQGLKRKAEQDVESDSDNEEDSEEMKIVKTTLWTIPESELAPDISLGESSEADKSIDLDAVRVETLHHVPAEERKPSNHYDLTIYATPPNTIQIQSPSVKTKRHDIGLIAGEYGAFVMTNVLSASECKQILAIAENKMKYIPDHPTALTDPTGIDTCEWLVDDSILNPIHERIMPLVNQNVHGEKVAGVNARWRLFRYGRERTYRPHIDGSWPGSGRSKTGEYTSDAFNGDRRSRYTFLIYLNDGFEGGGTTFYLPSKGGDGGFETVVVKPSRGSVLCFPQGNTASLLHEGSQVTGGGLKYVVRTDLLSS